MCVLFSVYLFQKFLGTPPNFILQAEPFFVSKISPATGVRFVMSEFRLFVLSLFSVLSGNLELELEQPKKKIAMPTKFIKKLGKYIQEKFDKYVNIES